MKKIFNHTKRSQEQWNHSYENEDENEIYADSCAETDDVYYAEAAEEGESYEEVEGVYYAEDAEEGESYEEVEGVYYAEDAEEGESYEEVEGVYYAEDAEEGENYEEVEGVYYAEDAEEGENYEEVEGVYYAEAAEEGENYEEVEGVYYAEDAEEGEGYEEGEDVYYTEDAEEFDEDEEAFFRGRKSRRDDQDALAGNWWHAFGTIFRDMSVMDRIITVTGAAVLILMLAVGVTYVGTQQSKEKEAEFASVGAQLQKIQMIGEKGLYAIADAEIARQAAASIVEEEEKEYDEKEYDDIITVKLNMTSVVKDLKVKFINEKTGRLVGNVPFTVSVTLPDGKTDTWSDDDMDGIIYKKDIKPGIYSVLVNELAGEKYEGVILPKIARTAEVKKEITYDKIDVSDEVKTEDEIDVSQEDTQKNDTQQESTLVDTIEFVESTVMNASYKEVAKNMILEPYIKVATLGLRTMLTEAPATVAETVTETPTTMTETQDKETTTPGVSAGDLGTFTATVNPTEFTLKEKETVSAQITVAGATEGVALKYSITSGNVNVATALVDSQGKIVVTAVADGKTTLTAVVDYAEGASMPVTIQIPVVVAGKPTITLDPTKLNVYSTEKVTIQATITGGHTEDAVVAESSNTTVATVAVDGRKVVVTGVTAGEATITVKYTENGETISATSTVKVTTHPKENKTDKLKDTSGNQIYVPEGDSYREAVYADYYTASSFFVRAEAKYTGWQTIDGKLYYYDKNGNKATGEQVIQGAKYNFASDGSLTTGSGTLGIDVSKWNGNIDWNAVKNAGVSYVIIRCGYRGSTKGMLIEDPTFTANIQGATKAGLKVGVYFFTQAVDVVEAVEEASFVLDQVKKYRISYPIFLDVESSGGRGDQIDKASRTAVCKTFCETIQRHGYTAGIYANKTWLSEKINTSELGSYKIWLAQYASEPTYTGRYDMWQYKDTGAINGIKGNVDMNLSYLGY